MSESDDSEPEEARMKISLHIEEWELTQPFRISGFEWVNSRGIVVQLAEDGFVGRG